MKRMRNGLRIVLGEKLLGQESELKTQRLQFSKRRMISRMLKSRDSRPENQKRCVRRGWFLSKTV
jgi:hypothetical protein